MKKLASGLFLLLLTGCESYGVVRYEPGLENNLALRQLPPADAKVALAGAPVAFDSKCRAAGYLVLPGGMSIDAFVEDALQRELKLAGLDHGPAMPLALHVDEAAFSTNETGWAGYWSLAATLTGPNGSVVRESVRYPFQATYFADSACRQAAQELGPATRQLVGQFARSPAFAAMLTEGQR